MLPNTNSNGLCTSVKHLNAHSTPATGCPPFLLMYTFNLKIHQQNIYTNVVDSACSTALEKTNLICSIHNGCYS